MREAGSKLADRRNHLSVPKEYVPAGDGFPLADYNVAQMSWACSDGYLSTTTVANWTLDAARKTVPTKQKRDGIATTKAGEVDSRINIDPQ